MSYSNYETCAIRPQIKLSEWDILTSLPTALVIVNAQGRIVWLNPLAEAMLGYGLVGSMWSHVIQKAFVPKDDDGHEVSLADGRRVHVAISSLESLPGIVITLADISTTRAYEKAQENEKRLMAIGTMTAQLAHQIRTPLSSAMLFTEHLQALPHLNSQSKSWLRKLQDSHASIEQQIQDLLLFARGASFELENTDMHNWCEQVLERTGSYIQNHGASLNIINQLARPKALIHKESLIGAVLNLVINALQAEAKNIEIRLASEEGSGIQIVVEDNGLGMAEPIKAQALQPFFTTKAKGTGLGLAVVFSVIKAHGGHVVLESSLGKGTQVSLYLPSKEYIR